MKEGGGGIAFRRFCDASQESLAPGAALTLLMLLELPRSGALFGVAPPPTSPGASSIRFSIFCDVVEEKESDDVTAAAAGVFFCGDGAVRSEVVLAFTAVGNGGGIAAQDGEDPETTGGWAATADEGSLAMGVVVVPAAMASAPCPPLCAVESKRVEERGAMGVAASDIRKGVLSGTSEREGGGGGKGWSTMPL